MSRHARPVSGRGGGWFIFLAFAILLVGAYLANAVDSNSQRPAIGLAALAAAILALFAARSERQSRRRMEELAEAQRRDAWRTRAELDEAHARSQRALQRAIAAEAAVHTLIAATENLLAVQRHAMAVAAAAQPVTQVPAALPVYVPPVEPSPIFEQAAAPVLQPILQPVLQPGAALPPAPPVFTPAAAPAQPAAAAFADPWAPDSFSARPTGTGVQAPAAALLDPPTTLVWPLADLPAPRQPSLDLPALQRQSSLDLPLVSAGRPRVTPLFVPVESPDAEATPSGSAAPGSSSSTGVEPAPATQNVDLTSTVTRYARPA